MGVIFLCGVCAVRGSRLVRKQARRKYTYFFLIRCHFRHYLQMVVFARCVVRGLYANKHGAKTTSVQISHNQTTPQEKQQQERSAARRGRGATIRIKGATILTNSRIGDN